MSLLPRSALLEKQIFTSKLIDMKIKITKRFLLSLCLMTLTLLCGGNKAWGQAATTLFLENFGTTGNKTAVASYTGWSATSSMFTNGTVSTNYSSPDASKINSTNASSYDGASGSCNVYNSGVANTTKTILKITNINIEGYSDITLNFGCCFGNTGHKIDVSYIIDNGTETNLTLDAYTVTEGDQWLYLSGKIPSTGKSLTLIFKHTPSRNWLMRLDDIKVTGVASTTTPAPTFSHATGTYNGPQHVTITAPKGYTEGIVYTTDGTEPTTSGTAKNYSEAGIDITATTTLRAVAYDSELNFSSEATATYTIRSTDQKTYSITFDFSKPADYGYSAPAKGSGTDLKVGNTIVSNDVTITNTKTGTTNTRFYNSSGKITFRPYKGAELSISVPAGYVITSIETQGTAGVFDLGGNSATKGVCTWEGLAQTVVLNHITTNAVLTSMTVNYRLLYFSDTEDLKASLPTTSPLADQTVTLNRNLYSGWNTFCVPFALTQAQLEEAYGSGAVAKYLSGVTTDGAAATLHFAPEAESGIKANKAYLLYLTADVTEAKTFSGVTLEPAGKCTTTVNTDNGYYTFQGILAPTTLATNDTQYFLNSAGTYFVLPLNNTSQMKATRAYIIVPAPAAPAQGRQYSFDFNGTTTAIDNVTVSGMEDGAWYTISGIRINRPAAKGVYIHNGRKVIVK